MKNIILIVACFGLAPQAFAGANNKISVKSAIRPQVLETRIDVNRARPERESTVRHGTFLEDRLSQDKGREQSSNQVKQKSAPRWQMSDGQDRGGGDTYLSQFRESFVVAAETMKKASQIEVASGKLSQAYLQYRNNWIRRLESNPIVTESLSPLFVDSLEKAAVANPEKGTIELNVKYWESHPLSMVQSVVLAIHEAGHLEKIPLSHRELDEIGFALVNQNLKEYFGISGLQKISETHSNLSPREKLKILFDDSMVPATLNDFSFEINPKQSCIVYPPRPEVLYSHPVWFFKKELILAPDSPLFPGGQKQTIILSAFRSKGNSYDLTPANHTMEQTDRGLKVRLWADISADGDAYQAWVWFRYEFRKSGDLILFKMNVNDNNQDAYGYCWMKE